MMIPRTVRAALLLLWLPCPLAAQPQRVGFEFRVNSYTPGGQRSPSVACATSNDLVAAWSGPNTTGGEASTIFARRVDASGSALGSLFEAPGQSCPSPACPMAPSFDPSLCRDDARNFVVVWERAYAADGDGSAVFGQRFDSSGAARGSEFQVNSYTRGYQYAPAVGCEPDGDFVVTWQQENGGDLGVFGHRFSSAGAKLGTELRVDANLSEYQSGPQLAVRASGEFVVVWASGGYFGSPDGGGLAVTARRFSSAGAAQGTEFVVNTYTQGYQQRPSVATLVGGVFVVVWESGDFYTMRDGSYSGVFARRLSSTGQPLGVEFQVNGHTNEYQQRPVVSADGLGDFVVAWQSGDAYGTHDGSYGGVFARRFLSTGSAHGGEFQVNTYTAGDQAYPSVCADDLGSFVVAWESIGQDGDEAGIFGRAHVVSDLTGHIRYYGQQRPVPDTDVDLLGNPQPTTATNGFGGFAFGEVAQGMRTLRPHKNGDINGAVTSLDAAWAGKFRVGMMDLDEMQQLACDVTGNGTISSLDAARIVQFRVGIIDRLPVANTCDSDWLFLPDPAAAPNQTLLQPAITTTSCTLGGIAYNPLVSPVHAQDFIAILFGDCTKNWKP